MEYVYAKEEILDFYETNDLPYELELELLLDQTKDQLLYIIHMEGDPESKINAEPVSIDDLFKKLLGYKGMGATHVKIAYHMDHQTYLLEASKITRLTPEQEAKYKAGFKEKREEIIDQQIKELENRIKALKENR